MHELRKYTWVPRGYAWGIQDGYLGEGRGAHLSRLFELAPPQPPFIGHLGEGRLEALDLIVVLWVCGVGQADPHACLSDQIAVTQRENDYDIITEICS